MATRRRLDAELVRRGLAHSRAEAVALVEAGRVTVGGAPAPKASRLVDAGEPVEVLGPPARFVSRGGEKLDAALTAFGVHVAGRRVLDAGASTGGFTDCCLQRGTAEVVAVDVGHGQLHPRLRADARVRVFERLHVRELTLAHTGEPVDVVVADLSFISLRSVLPALLGVCAPGADLVLLVKPQFEAGRAEVSRGKGVVKDPAVHERVRQEIEAALAGLGARVLGWIPSPIRGAEGNVELLVHALAPGRGVAPSEL
jgi:23S rRNA (cytidine1920-2'-O)/16S rRNA (cytidine1409-2'-O)-methyltransferase